MSGQLRQGGMGEDAGVVCDRGLTLGDLIGILQLFFQRLGLPKLRFKPAFNPYTEPSMEIFRFACSQDANGHPLQETGPTFHASRVQIMAGCGLGRPV